MLIKIVAGLKNASTAEMYGCVAINYCPADDCLFLMELKRGVSKSFMDEQMKRSRSQLCNSKGFLKKLEFDPHKPLF